MVSTLIHFSHPFISLPPHKNLNASIVVPIMQQRGVFKFLSHLKQSAFNFILGFFSIFFSMRRMGADWAILSLAVWV